jgi:hypothetical protein
MLLSDGTNAFEDDIFRDAPKNLYKCVNSRGTGKNDFPAAIQLWQRAGSVCDGIIKDAIAEFYPFLLHPLSQ